MEGSILFIINAFFFIFHGILIVFNLFGWAIEKLKIWNLLSLSLTGGSWFILGIWKGWGYCPCTEWHFEVRRQLNLEVGTNSYIHFLLMQIGIQLPKEIIDYITLSAFFISLLISLYLNRNKVKNEVQRLRKQI